jgi:outer membrane protein, multidrug efflux system
MIDLKTSFSRHWSRTLLAAACGALTSCAVGPNYQRPELKVPAAYKRGTAEEAAQPVITSTWWTLFDDPALTALVEETANANLDIQAAIARVDEARAATRSAQGNFYPTLDLGARATRSGNASGASWNYSLPFDLGYEFDIWGRLRRQYESTKDSERATTDDLEFVRQTTIADIAQAYFNIRLFDQQITSFETALDLYRKQLELTETKFKAGLALRTDVLQANTQVDSARNQLIEVQRSRAKQEHAIAILLGRPPSEYTLERTPSYNPPIPTLPAGLPVNLLGRRPDVAEAELRLAAANALVGVAKANFFPSFSLSASAGYQSSNIEHLLDWEKRVWSIGPAITAPIYEGGQISAAYVQAKARYKELIATYRSTVLRAFEDVEDQLSDLHLLAEKAKSLDDTLVSAHEYSRLTEQQYRQGLTTYLQVIDANQTLLTNELSAAEAQSQRLAATVLLIKALGGGWTGDEIPKK